MNIVAAVAAILAPAAAFQFVLRRCALPGSEHASASERVGTSIALSLGFSSVVFFLARLMSLPLWAIPVVEAITLLVVVFAVARWCHATSGAAAQKVSDARTTETIVALTSAATLVAAAIMVIRRFEAAPHGDWDAWAIWNLRAAFLAAPTTHWADGFTPLLMWSHPDYPLFLPASVARLWQFSGTESPMAPILVGSAVLVAIVLVLIGGALRFGRVAAGASLVLLLVPEYLLLATMQCADVPLGLFALLAIVMLAGGDDRGRLVVAGAAAGFCAWTKNEGAIVALAIALALFLVGAFRQGWTGTVRRAIWFAAGLAGPIAVVLLFSTAVAPPSDLVAGMVGPAGVAKLTSAERHAEVARLMFPMLWRWGQWSLLSPVAVLGVWLLVGFVRRSPSSEGVLMGAAVLGVVVAGYYFVYVLTPYDLSWHIQSSWSRLIGQLWPMAVWTATAAAFSHVKP